MQTDATFQDYRHSCCQRVTRALETCLPKAAYSPQRLHEAMRYAVLGGGKRIRPLLVYAAGQAVGASPERLEKPSCAVELIHASSLVHDDLPSMDDDALRRGVPTCHKAYDEATAILVGDALLMLAFQVLAQDTTQTDAVRVHMITSLTQASGSRGMVGGQALDMAAVGQQIDLTQLENMHIHKTGALIRASVHLGVLGGTEVAPETQQHLDRYAKYIGLAFQVQDDLLDVTGHVADTGKQIGKDASANKPTYPALLGLQGTRDMAKQLLQDALAEIVSFDERADPLRQLARYIIQRTG